MTETPPTPSEGATAENYEAMIESLDGVIAEVERKIEDGRIRDVETEKVRIQQYRALGYLIRTKRKVLEDKTLEELAEEVERLKDEDGVRVEA